jgi:hypothetical protein
MKAWLTYSEASLLLGRSKRTLRRWAADPSNRLRIRHDDQGIPLLNAEDVHRVEAAKTAYRATPTFGRNRT